MKWKSLVLLAVLSLGSLFASAADLPPEAVDQILALVAEKSTRTPAQRRMDSQLLQAVRESRGEAMTAGVHLLPVAVATDTGGKVLLDLDVASADRLDAVVVRLEALGAEIVLPSWAYRTIRLRLPLSAAEAAAGIPDVTFVKFAADSKKEGAAPVKSGAAARAGRRGPGLDGALRALAVRSVLKSLLASGRRPLTGSVDSQGDRTHRADDTRNAYGYAGQGVRIGVISDSFNSQSGAAADVASGNLPGPGNPLGNTTPVTVLEDLGLGVGTDEGRAMLQIVHDVAPKAQLFFATADVSEADFASNILALRNAPNNCDIIIDDIVYFDEPVFQDGIVAQAVNTVTASGGLYFSSAGNEGSVAKGTAGYFEGDFSDAGSPPFTFPGGAKVGTIHNFGTVGSPVNGDILTAQGGRYTLNWADPANASTNDYDLFLVSVGGVVKASSTNIQSGTQLAFEQIVPPVLAAGDRLVVFKTAAAAVRGFALNTFGGHLTVATTGQTFGHAAAVDAFGVAATPAAGAFGGGSPAGPYPGPFGPSNNVENFSSDGPRRVFYNANGTPITPGNFLFGTNGGAVRNKPDVTAADGVSTTLSPVSGLNPFFGTSAAAPHAGAIAGLLKSAKPTLTAAQIRTILTTTAVDIETAGYDNVSGFGILQAFQAMQAVSPTPQATLLVGTVTPAEGAFSNGNGSIDPGETATLVVQLQDPSLVAATAVSATLTSSTPGVTITQGSAAYGTIAAGGAATNAGTPFAFGVDASVPCGTPLTFTLTATFSGGPSPQVFLFTVTVGFLPGASISSTLGNVPPTGPGFTSSSGTQTGRVTRNGLQSSCASPKANPGLTATTGARQFDAYTFVNPGATPQCVTVTLNATNGVNLYSIAYNLAGFVPANPSTNYMADPGTSSTAQTYSFTAPAGFAFTVVVHEVNPGGGIGSAYTLSLSLAECAAGPACTPVTVTTPSVAPGSFGIAYSQSFAATGGSGAYTISQTGTLPTGLSFSGNTISGTPTQTGTFPITITPHDAAGCSSTPKGFLLVVGGTATGFFNTVSPCRSLDTRAGAPIAGGGTIVAMLSGGACGIPADATAVSVNVTATQPAAPGFVNLYPGNQPPPPTSTMNFSGGQTRANNAIVSLATDGSGTIKITNGAAGTVHVIVDVNGYFK